MIYNGIEIYRGMCHWSNLLIDEETRLDKPYGPLQITSNTNNRKVVNRNRKQMDTGKREQIELVRNRRD